MNIEHDLTNDVVRDWAKMSLLDPLSLSFSKWCEATVDWRNARFSVLAASNCTKEQLLDFKHGGKMDGNPIVDDWFVEQLSVRQRSDDFLLVEDWHVTPRASFLEQREMPGVYFNDEVYYLIAQRNAVNIPNWGRIFSNSVPLFHAFVVRGVPPAVDDRRQVQHETFRSLAGCVATIVFGVYDGESYLLCDLVT